MDFVVFLQREINRGTVLLDVQNLAMTLQVSQPIGFFFYLSIAVMQYRIISPDRFTPTIIFILPISSNWQRVSNKYLNAFWLATPFLGGLGLPNTMAFRNIQSNCRIANVDFWDFAAWRMVSVIETKRMLMSPFSDGL